MKAICGLCHKPLDGLIDACAGHPMTGEAGMSLREIDLYLFKQLFREDADPLLVEQMREALRGSRKDD